MIAAPACTPSPPYPAKSSIILCNFEVPCLAVVCSQLGVRMRDYSVVVWAFGHIVETLLIKAASVEDAFDRARQHSGLTTDLELLNGDRIIAKLRAGDVRWSVLPA